MMRRIPGENSKIFFQRVKSQESRLMTQLAPRPPHFHSFVKIQDTKKGRKRRGKSNVNMQDFYFKIKGGRRGFRQIIWLQDK
jgi:hypothetical protein